MLDFHASSKAIVLRKTKLTETSLILSFLTEDHGRIKAVAKGARKNKGAFSGQLDLFYLCEISLRASQKSELHTLTEAKLITPHSAIREHYLRLLFASYASELIELATEPEHASPELFHLMQRLLGYLSEKTPDRRALTFFEMEICRASGITPESESHASRELLRHFHKLPESRRELVAALK
ncbi:MAG: DNA repair protein RecO [Chthoniobacterales bacterium]